MSTPAMSSQPSPAPIRRQWVAWLLGPLAWRGLARPAAGVLLVIMVTLLTQLGGIYLWLAFGALASPASRPARVFCVMGVATAYLASSLWLFPWLARTGGREALPRWSAEGNLRSHSWLYCLANRHYVVPPLARALERTDARLAKALPDRPVRWLDAGFPFGGGFPMLPHLSHGDGRRIDLMFLYQDSAGRPVDGNGSPIGYFAFEQPPAQQADLCPSASLSLRWDLDWLQHWLRKPELDEQATSTMLRVLLAEPAFGKLLLEPHLRQRLALQDGRIRFQGCRAARHDDHLHLQL